MAAPSRLYAAKRTAVFQSWNTFLPRPWEIVFPADRHLPRYGVLLAELYVLQQPLGTAFHRHEVEFSPEFAACDMHVELDADDVVKAHLLASAGQLRAAKTMIRHHDDRDPQHSLHVVHGGSLR